MRRGWRLGFPLGLAALVLTGCGGSRARNADGIPRTSGGLTAPLRLYRSATAATSLVAVRLEGHLYYFIVDTGAQRTIVDARVARTLGLRRSGRPREFATVGCNVSGQPVALPSWRLGAASFGPTTVFAQRLLVPRAFAGLPFGGLLGSDLLSRFGTMTIDFTHRRLILGGRPPTGGSAAPIKVLRRAGSVFATTQVEFDHRSARFFVDTGAAISLIDAPAAARLGLPVAGRSVRVMGAVCRAAVTPVLVRGWSIAGVHIRQAIIGRIPGVVPNRYLTERIIGIIGTSTLGRRGTLTLDFAHARMILGATPH